MNEPTFYQALQVVFDSLMSNVHTSLPGIIDKYDRSKHKADVKPMIKKKFRDGVTIDMPVITNVPIVWPRSSKGSLSFPLSRGDGVLILFSEKSIEEYLDSGKNKAPEDSRKFSLTDAIAIPGLFSFNNDSLTESEDAEFIFNDTKVILKKDGDIVLDGGNKITIKSGGDIELGEGVGLSAFVKESIISKYNLHTHSSPAGGSTGTPSQPFNSISDVTQRTKAQ